VNAFVSHGRGTKLRSDGRTCYSSRRSLLRSVAEGLATFGTINTAEPDTFSAVVVQNFDGVSGKGRRRLGPLPDLPQKPPENELTIR
jgi:hypothetical protein